MAGQISVQEEQVKARVAGSAKGSVQRTPCMYCSMFCAVEAEPSWLARSLCKKSK